MPAGQTNPTPEELQWLNDFMADQAAQLAQTSGAKAVRDFAKAMGGAAPEIQQAWLESEQSAVEEAASPAVEHAGGEATTTAAEDAVSWWWDDGWGMFYRIGPSGAYEYSDSADAAHTQPTGVWLPAEQVMTRRQQASAGASAQAQAPPVTPSAQGEPAQGGPAQDQQAPTPEDINTALDHFAQVGVPSLRGVVEDLDALAAELMKLGVEI